MAKKIVQEPERKYEVVTSCAIKDITKEVNALIEKGYKPLGGIVVATGIQRAGNPTTEQLFIQTMYKE